jgi:hypothetical protein
MQGGSMKRVATILMGGLFAIAATSPAFAQISAGAPSGAPISAPALGQHTSNPAAFGTTAPNSGSGGGLSAAGSGASAFSAPTGMPALPSNSSSSSASSPQPPSITPSSNGLVVTIPGANPESGPGPEGPNIGAYESAGVGEQPTGAPPGQVNSPGLTAAVAAKLDSSDLTSLPPDGFISVFKVGSGGQVAADINESEVIVKGGSQ